MKLFQVGGCVRDELLGVPSKDIDFTVVLGDNDVSYIETTGITPFGYMDDWLTDAGFEIFLRTPEFLTIRAKFPDETLPQRPGIISGTVDLAKRTRKGLTADFVLARKESDYTDGRRPDKVEPGTLMDDLARRDFTMNAIAKDADGNFIDPFNGQTDLFLGLIRTVNDPWKTFGEDYLRMMRALRFSVTKNFTIGSSEEAYIEANIYKIREISAERVREELAKMFNHAPNRAVEILNRFKVWEHLFAMGINFIPTMKEKVR